MRAEDVIERLRMRIPQFDTGFTTNHENVTLTRDGNVLTVQCQEVHNLVVGDLIVVANALTPIEITASTRAASTDPLSLTLAANHDVTYNGKEEQPVITITNSSDVEYQNLDFLVEGVPNRRTIELTSSFTNPDTITGLVGNPIALGATSFLQDYNGAFKVQAVLSPTSFTIHHDTAGLADPLGESISVQTKPRVTGAVTPERFAEAYTDKKVDEWYLVVVLEDTPASQDRRTLTDAKSEINKGEYFKQTILEPFSVYLHIPATTELMARKARDEVNRVFIAINKCILHDKFDSGFFARDKGTVTFVEHAFATYTGAVYVHRFSYAQVVTLLSQDTIGPADSVAYRDTSINIILDHGTQDSRDGIGTEIDQDEVPLP